MPLHPQESWTLLLMPPALLLLLLLLPPLLLPLFLFLHTPTAVAFSCYTAGSSACCSFWCTPSPPYFHTCTHTWISEPTPERPGAPQPPAVNSQIHRGLPLTSSWDCRYKDQSRNESRCETSREDVYLYLGGEKEKKKELLRVKLCWWSSPRHAFLLSLQSCYLFSSLTNPRETEKRENRCVWRDKILL